MAKQFTETFRESAQDRQFAGLLADLVDRIDDRFSNLEKSTPDKYLQAGAGLCRGSAGDVLGSHEATK